MSDSLRAFIEASLEFLFTSRSAIAFFSATVKVGTSSSEPIPIIAKPSLTAFANQSLTAVNIFENTSPISEKTSFIQPQLSAAISAAFCPTAESPIMDPNASIAWYICLPSPWPKRAGKNSLKALNPPFQSLLMKWPIASPNFHAPLSNGTLPSLILSSTTPPISLAFILMNAPKSIASPVSASIGALAS